MVKILLFRPEEKFEEIKSENVELINFPILKLVEEDFTLEDFDFDTFIFTSSFAYNVFKKKLGEKIKNLKGKRIIAIGEKTANSIEFPSFIPEEQSWRGIIDMIRPGERVLLVRSREGNRKLPEGIISKGAYLDIINAYHAEKLEENFKDCCRLLKQEKIDAIIFSSGMIVRTFFEFYKKYCEKDVKLPKIIFSLGKETSENLKNYVKEFIELDKPDIFKAIKIIKNGKI